MSEILQNTGAKLWSLVEDHDELQTNVFDQLFGTGGSRRRDRLHYTRSQGTSSRMEKEPVRVGTLII